jgi:hypothetical protein
MNTLECPAIAGQDKKQQGNNNAEGDGSNLNLIG